VYHLLTINRNWDLMKKRVDALAAEAASRDGRRSVLRGAVVAGNAWDEYSSALEVAQMLQDSGAWEILFHFIERRPEVDRRQVEELLSSNTLALNHLRQGATRNDGQFPYEWQKGRESPDPKIGAPRALAYLAVAQARVWSETGRPEDAIDLLLDTSVFARDLSFNGTYASQAAGFITYFAALDEIRSVLQSNKLRRESLLRISKELETLDREFPPLGPILLNETLFDGITMMEIDAGRANEAQSIPLNPLTPRVLGRIMYFHSFSAAAAAATSLQDSDRKPYATMVAEVEVAHRNLKASWNPLIHLYASNTQIFGRNSRYNCEVISLLRVLRTAAEYRALGQAPSLDDPFGEKLMQSNERGKLRIWSVGSDQKDDGGKGGTKWEPGAFTPGQDIVLEIEASKS
jgi:hypothetical protein